MFLWKKLTSLQFWAQLSVLMLAGLKFLWKFLKARGIQVCKLGGSLARDSLAYLSRPGNQLLKYTVLYTFIWLALFWLWTSRMEISRSLTWSFLPIFLVSWCFAALWLKKAFQEKWSLLARLRLISLCLVPFFQVIAFLLDRFKAANFFETVTFAIVAIIGAAWFCRDLATGSHRLRKNLTIGYSIAWCGFFLLWFTERTSLPKLFLFLFFSLSLHLVYTWIRIALEKDDRIYCRTVASICIFPVWQWLVFTTKHFTLGIGSGIAEVTGKIVVCFAGFVWAVWAIDRKHPTTAGRVFLTGLEFLWTFLKAKGIQCVEWGKTRILEFLAYLSRPENKFLKYTVIYIIVWLNFFYIWTSNIIPWEWLLWCFLPIFLCAWFFAGMWLKKAIQEEWSFVAILRLSSLCLIPFFQVLTFILDRFTYELAKIFGGLTFGIVAYVGAIWFCWDLTTGSLRSRKNLTIAYTIGWCWLWHGWSTGSTDLPESFLFLFFSLSIYLAYCWLDIARHWNDTIRFRAVASICILPVWQWLVFTTNFWGWSSARAVCAGAGLATTFFVGLAWAIWYVDRRSWEIQQERFYEAAEGEAEVDFTGPLASMGGSAAVLKGDDQILDPFDLDACYYGNSDRKKLNQSFSTIGIYTLLFFLLFLILTSLSGCIELYEMPQGGGEQKQVQQVVVQKVIKKKFVINPFSAVIFNPPPIDQVKLQLTELTKHAYTVGYGKGKGAGFSGGTNRGMVRFIRLEYSGGDWDQDFGIGADLNLLLEYGIRTRHKVAKKTESRKIAQLRNFPVGKSPPMLYITGQRNIHLSKKDIEILREYLTVKQGMLFADNGGSSKWHGQFFNLMKQVLPTVRPVRVPLDHAVHQVPYIIPFLPYVAPHGGKDAFGWVVDSRLVAYYHPGDIGDAWADGHAGVKPEIAELCYQLGTNVIFYAHAEYNKWLDRRKQKK